jgi:2-hydroxychromene-2-carboxylate isomerase
MGIVVSLDDYRRRRAGDGHGPTGTAAAAAAAPAAAGCPVTFSFCLGDPRTYLAAERVERSFGTVRWEPVLSEAIGAPPCSPAELEARAGALRLPLVWPEHAGAWHDAVRPAMRVAALAVERGRGAAFVIAAGRLAYGGGYAPDHPEALAEAAAAAGLSHEEALAAAADAGRDGPMLEAAHRLRRGGADRLPVLAVEHRLFPGEERVAEAIFAARAVLPATRAG